MEKDHNWLDGTARRPRGVPRQGVALRLRGIGGLTLRALAAAALLGAAAAATTARAQQPTGVHAQIVSVSTGAYPSARAVVNIEGAPGGAPIAASAFTATLDGRPAAVSAVDLASTQDLPLDVLFLMDVSGSMQGNAIARAKEAASAFIQGLAPKDRVAVIAFSDAVHVVQDYTTDRALAAAAINGLVASGNTALYQATDQAARMAAASSASRRVVILLSDGAQDGVPLTVTRDQAVQSAAAAGVPFFAIGEGTSIDRGYLRGLADATKGRYLEAPDPAGLTALYAGIGKLLSSQYVVTFDAAGAHAGSVLALQLSVGGQTASSTLPFTPAADFAPPPVTIQGLSAGDTLTAARTITVDVGSRPAAQVTITVDGAVVADLSKPPYTYKLDPARLGAGDHTVGVGVRDGSAAAPVLAGVTFRAAPPPAPSGGVPLLPVAAAVAVGVLLAVSVGLVLRARAAKARGGAGGTGVLAWPTPEAAAAPEPVQPAEASAPEADGVMAPLGILIARDGPALGMEFDVGGSPVGVGSGVRCGVQLDDLAAEEARVWVRDGHLMLHRLTRLTAIVNEGTTGGWQILEPGDTFAVGQHRFEFRLIPVASPEPPAGDIPNVLRDPDRPARPEASRGVGPRGPLAPPRTSAFSELMPRNDLGSDRD